MLSQIINLLKSSQKPLSLEQLSHQVDIERSALEAMLEHLIQRGKINKISPTITDADNKQPFPFCPGCQTKAYCSGEVTPPVYYESKQQEKGSR